jgi:methylmalonyl-CoA mutase C-terminal domain/subunit
MARANASPPLRVLLAKLGLDGHDRGIKVVARALRDAGMEVIYTGLRQTPETVAQAALEEDVPVIGVSLLSGAHMTLVPRLLDALRAAGRADIGVIVGGIVTPTEARQLESQGVAQVFGPGTPLEQIVESVRQTAESRRVAGS